MAQLDRVDLKHSELEAISMVCLRAAKIVMECGGRGVIIHKCAMMIARGLGAECLGLRTGYSSIDITLSRDGNIVTNMVSVGWHGVNHRLDQNIRHLASLAERGQMSAEEINKELDCLVRNTFYHSAWFIGPAVGLACASFGRLLGADWAAFIPVFVGCTISQLTRRLLIKRNTNIFVVAALIAFLSSMLSDVGARLAGSQTINLAIMASFLLLVPGVPAANTLADIMDGYPTLGSARAIFVIMIMLFATTGIWAAQVLLGVH
jgi:uncharacterized membrane protein YjjP (DUF1212 family)